MRLAYLMNTYPLVSTTFIVREIEAMERLGHPVTRYAIRRWSEDVVDARDKEEQARTRYLLTGPKGDLARAMLLEPITNPVRLWRAVRLLMRLVVNARGGLVRHVAYLAEAALLRRLCARDGITHVHAHFATNAAAVAMLCEALGGPPYSVTVHGPSDFFSPFTESLALKVERAAFVACISHYCRSQVMLFTDQACWPKLIIVHCGVDPALYGDAREAGGGAGLLFVGRLAGVKGVPILLEAFRRLAPRFPVARLTLVGGGPDRDALERLAETLGVADRVSFEGYRTRDEVGAYLRDCDLFVLPSFAEGVPVVLMEAMAARRAVVATRVAGVAELVEDGVSGLLVPPGDVDTLTAAIERLLADPSRRAAMGEAGRAKVVEAFDVDAEAAWLVDAFARRQAGEAFDTRLPVAAESAAVP
jgi:glycosyltransferase involved in cell wall biosynthesis